MSENEKLSTREGREKRHDELTATVKGIVDKEKAAQDSKTEKLRKLREARDDAAVPPEKNKSAKEALNKLEKQLRSIRDNINAAPDIHGINRVSLDLVREAVSSLEAEGQSLDSLRRKEVVVAKRILRLHPGRVAI